MHDIEFELEQNGEERRDSQSPKQPWMVRFIMGFGIVDPGTANMILLGITAIFFGISIFLYAGLLGDSVSQAEKYRLEQAKYFSGMPNF